MKRVLLSTIRKPFTTKDHRSGQLYVDTVSGPDIKGNKVYYVANLIYDTAAKQKFAYFQDYEDWTPEDLEDLLNANNPLSTFFEEFRQVAQGINDSLELDPAYHYFVYYYVTFYGIGNRHVTVYFGNDQPSASDRTVPSYFPDQYRVDDQYGQNLAFKKTRKKLLLYVLDKLCYPIDTASRSRIDNRKIPDSDQLPITLKR